MMGTQSVDDTIAPSVLMWQATPKTALGDVIGAHTNSGHTSITKALMEARASQPSQQWYCGGPRTAFIYKPPHHRYRTDKNISKILYSPDGTIGCQRLPANVSNTMELWSVPQVPVLLKIRPML